LASILSTEGLPVGVVSEDVLPRLVAALDESRMRRDLGTILKFVSAGQESQRLERILAAAPMTPDLLFVCYEVGLLPEALLTLASHLTEQHLEKAYYRAVKERVDAIATRGRCAGNTI